MDQPEHQITNVDLDGMVGQLFALCSPLKLALTFYSPDWRAMWQNPPQIQSLALVPGDDAAVWIKFANLCRKNAHMQLADKTIRSPLIPVRGHNFHDVNCGAAYFLFSTILEIVL